MAAVVVAMLCWAPAGHAQGQGPYVDWPALLPALPAPFTPNVEPDCADGSDACIDRTIVEMQRRLNAVVPRCDHRAVFSLAYLRVTEDVRAARQAGTFKDPAWLNSEDAVFARMYFSVYDAYAAGQRSGIPAAWLLAFDSERDRQLSALGDFLMSMNAHINRDMPFVLAGIGITKPDGTTRKGDHDAYNRHLANLYAPVLKEVAQRFDPTADDAEIGPVDDVLAAAILQSWREGVWRNTERLVNARGPAERAQVADSIELLADTIGRGIRALTQADPAARDAWCAQHGGQDPALVAGVAPAAVGGNGRAGRALITARSLRTATRTREVRVPLACPATAGACRGRILVRLPHGGRLLTSAAYTLASGTSRTVAIDLRAPARRQARRVRTIRITLTRDGIAGKAARTSRMVRVR
ncbi:MAG: hypothetical protein JWN65_2246 [Solirubrobacterales bacterium]|nr:hypothetical protein [Solirubrobacterales bacterium]